MGKMWLLMLYWEADRILLASILNETTTQDLAANATELPLHSTFSFWKRAVSNPGGFQKTNGTISIFPYIIKDSVHLHHLIWVQTCPNTSTSFLHQRVLKPEGFKFWLLPQHKGESLFLEFLRLLWAHTAHYAPLQHSLCRFSLVTSI